MSDLKGEQAILFERFVGLGNEATIDIESRLASEERGGGLMVADLRVKGEAVDLRDIRRVADNGVELFFRAEFAQQVGLEEADAVGYVVFAGIGSCYGERVERDVERGDRGVGKMGGKSDRDGTGTGAYVNELQRSVGWKKF